MCAASALGIRHLCPGAGSENQRSSGHCSRNRKRNLSHEEQTRVNGKDFCTAPFSLETVTAEVVRSKISKVTLKPKFRQRYKHGQKGCDLPVDATLLCDIGRSFAESH